ncbi:MAG: DUF1801 domain-containing protein [Gemmatimonadota bacterium]|nr:DUF1801 domain-containing protein [Gemmatimonadota bacterium]
MAELKTKRNDGDVEAFLNSVEHDKRREDSFVVLDLMRRVTGLEPEMWGGSIVGFGSYHYKYASGREGDWFKAGFAPRKQALTLYMMAGTSKNQDLYGKLGKYTTGKGCLYIKKLEDIDLGVLEQLVAASAAYVEDTSAE